MWGLPSTPVRSSSVAGSAPSRYTNEMESLLGRDFRPQGRFGRKPAAIRYLIVELSIYEHDRGYRRRLPERSARGSA